MRVAVLGAGGIGGAIGARLFEAGHSVVLVARGEHGDAIRRHGLTVETPESTTTVKVPCVATPSDIDWTDDDVVVLAAQSQHTADALAALSSAASPDTPVVCAQNGVENERAALRLFANVYAMCVMCPTTRLMPGVVQAWSTPLTGILDLGRYPSGSDDVAEAVAGALSAATFESVVRPDIMRWKYAKLLMNLGNAVEAVCGPQARGGPVGARAKEEGVACLTAAAIDFVSDEEDEARRGSLLQMRPIAGQRREGGSSWQALSRAGGSIETDFINGEIVLLGRTLGIPTPVNAALQRHATRMAREGAPPGGVSEEDVLSG